MGSSLPNPWIRPTKSRIPMRAAAGDGGERPRNVREDVRAAILPRRITVFSSDLEDARRGSHPPLVHHLRSRERSRIRARRRGLRTPRGGRTICQADPAPRTAFNRSLFTRSPGIVSHESLRRGVIIICYRRPAMSYNRVGS